MRVVFVSNYINHHQIPFCNAMHAMLEGQFSFLQTEAMEEERVRMGWHSGESPSYVRRWYEEPEACRKLVMDCDVALFGGTDDESYISERLQAGKPVIRISERLYKTGQWKAVSPRGLRRKYLDHTRYRNRPVYLLCAGAYVPSDFRLVRAYPGKMFCWGYFPETRQYDTDALMAGKGWNDTSCGEETSRVPYLLWAGRMIGWKHPELALETARYLKEKGLPFHMEIVGDGERKGRQEELRSRYGLEDQVSFSGFLPPEEVRRRMEKADIFLITSDRQEGWGAVANEAMNSGCAVVADHMIGAAPYLIAHGENGLIYRDGNEQELFRHAERLTGDRELCCRLGLKAYRTITEVWNAEKAAAGLIRLAESLLRAPSLRENAEAADSCFHGKLSPCAPAPVLWEREAGRACREMERLEAMDRNGR